MSENDAREDLDHFMAGVRRRNPYETEFHQAVEEVAMHVLPFTASHPEYRKKRIFERMTEPDRVLTFRVCWEDDEHNVRVNRGYRVQCNNAIGPYKGGIRFAPNVNQSVLKFLAFEQTFKNSLTGLPMGGAKGGADFNPKGKSDAEVMRFCQAFMIELHRHIGPNTDIPAGDIGVGSREVGYLFGQYKRLENRFEGVLTGKAVEFGGSHIRTESTGYGVVYMMEQVLRHVGDDLEGKRCVISGSGNVALYTAEKLIDLGARVVSLSDSSGTVVDDDGFDRDKLAWVKDLKQSRRGRIRKYAEEFGVPYLEGEAPWAVPCDLAFPCATQNELDSDSARALIDGGCKAIAEGANMPSTAAAIRLLHDAGVRLVPAKAANAGGVAVSGLEMSQNSLRLGWSREEVDERLRAIVHRIHEQCLEYGEEKNFVDYLRGANIAGFRKVATAMLAYGIG